MNDTLLTIEERDGVIILPGTAFRQMLKREKKLRDRIHSLEFQLECNRRNVKRLKAKLKRCEYPNDRA